MKLDVQIQANADKRRLVEWLELWIVRHIKKHKLSKAKKDALVDYLKFKLDEIKEVI